MSKKAAVYDVKKLTWLNGQYLSSLPLREIADASVPFFKKAGLIDDNYLPAHQEYFDHLVDVVRVRVKTLEEVADASAYFFKDVESYDEKGAAKFFKPEAAELLQKCYDALAALEVFDLKTTEDAYNKLAEDLGLSLGKVIHPTRLALTGRTFSPGMFDVMVLLGKEKTLARLQQAIAYIKRRKNFLKCKKILFPFDKYLNNVYNIWVITLETVPLAPAASQRVITGYAKVKAL